MVIDASALMAIFLREPERELFLRAIANDRVRLLTPMHLLETHMLLRTRRGDIGVHTLDHFLIDSALEIAPTDAAQLAIARGAFDRYGKGRHPAALNIADCFAYALSKTSGEPLLFKGDDFRKTDVIAAI